MQSWTLWQSLTMVILGRERQIPSVASTTSTWIRDGFSHLIVPGKRYPKCNSIEEKPGTISGTIPFPGFTFFHIATTHFRQELCGRTIIGSALNIDLSGNGGGIEWAYPLPSMAALISSKSCCNAFLVAPLNMKPIRKVIILAPNVCGLPSKSQESTVWPLASWIRILVR